MFEKSVTICCKLAQSKNAANSKQPVSVYDIAAQAIGYENKIDSLIMEEKKLRIQSLACLTAITKSMVVWSTHRSFQSRNASPNDITLEDMEIIETPKTIVIGKNPLNSLILSQIDHSKNSTNILSNHPPREERNKENDIGITGLAGRKQKLAQGIELFNTKPIKGIIFLIENNLLESNTTKIAQFLVDTSDLAKRSIGEYIGEGDTFNKSVMHEFIDLLDLATKGFVPALRFMLQTFRLPGEAVSLFH